MKYEQDELSVAQVAEILGIARTTVYRWQYANRLPFRLTQAFLDAHAEELRPRPRGPKKNRKSMRYGPHGRHRFVQHEESHGDRDQ